MAWAEKRTELLTRRSSSGAAASRSLPRLWCTRYSVGPLNYSRWAASLSCVNLAVSIARCQTMYHGLMWEGRLRADEKQSFAECGFVTQHNTAGSTRPQRLTSWTSIHYPLDMHVFTEKYPTMLECWWLWSIGSPLTVQGRLWFTCNTYQSEQH